MHKVFIGLAACCVVAASCGDSSEKKSDTPASTVSTADSQTVSLPEPFATKSVKNFSTVIGWDSSAKPTAPAGFTVTKFADGLVNPRWIYVAENGDIFISEANKEAKGIAKVKNDLSGKSKSQSALPGGNRIMLFRDKDKDGKYESRFDYLAGVSMPFGMLVLGNSFYAAGTDGVWQFPYDPSATSITAKGKKIVELPAGGYNNHWTRNIIANKDGSKIYISVGSGSNVAEHGIANEFRRANILEVNPDGSGEKVYASGLRNPVGMDWAPDNNVLWTAVNERDELGDELVPDYITSVKQGGFYGWPYAYFGQNEDPRRKGENAELVKTSIVPDVAMGSHTASLGLAFYKGSAFPGKYANGAFVGQHGSWNRSSLSGYKVMFVPFSGGKPSGAPEDFLTGFIADPAKNEVHGRPVGVAVTKSGTLLVADDSANTIWEVSAAK
jgi:glucose/arabinose dehydrogenase